MDFQGIRISVQHHDLKSEIVRPSFAYAEIADVEHPRELCVLITPQRRDDTIPLSVFKGVAASIEERYSLIVPVMWNQGTRGRSDMPSTRQRGVDNVDIVLLREDGNFVEVQIGVVTRGKKFFITAQQIYKGWVARTVGDGVATTRYTFTPSDGVHAYPGANYECIWAGVSDELERVARHEGTSRWLSRVKPAKWNPPVVPSRESWKSGVMLYFNLITGTGIVQDQFEVEYMVHFSKILDAGPMPVLEPMTGVYFRLGEQPNGKQGISSLRVM